MSFLYPSFLWAMAILAIPIIVHLFNFRKAQKVYFSNVRFLFSVKEKNKSKLKLKHLLALLARLLTLAFLVIAFAQPYLPSDKDFQPGKQVYIYLDNSQSMSSLSEGNRSAFDEAYAIAESIIKNYPQDTRFKLLTNDFAPFSNNLKSGREILEIMTELNLSDNVRAFEEVINRLSIEGNDGNPADVFFISDFQKSTLKLEKNIDLEDTINRYTLLPVVVAPAANVYVDSIYLEKPFLLPNEPNKLIVILKNSGNEDIADLPLRFFIEENQVAATGVDITKNSTATVELDLSYTLRKINRCRISIEDFPVTFDNDHFFTLQLANKATVIELRTPSATNAFKAVFGNEEVFNFQSFATGNINFAVAANADLLIINEVPSINPSQQSLLKEIMGSGGTVLLVPAEDGDSASYATLVKMPLAKIRNPQSATLAQINYQNPFFDGVFTETSMRYEMPTATKTWIWPRRGEQLISFPNDMPFLSSFNQPKGRFMMLAGSLSKAGTDFHRHAIFVPTLYKTAISSVKSNAQLSYSVDQNTIDLALDSISYNSVYRLVHQDGEIIPDQRFFGNKLIMTLPKSEVSTGFYEVKNENETPAIIALNTSKKESELERLNRLQVSLAFTNQKNVTISAALNSRDFDTDLRQRFEGRDLWKYALILVLIFILAEILILRFL